MRLFAVPLVALLALHTPPTRAADAAPRPPAVAAPDVERKTREAVRALVPSPLESLLKLQSDLRQKAGGEVFEPVFARSRAVEWFFARRKNFSTARDSKGEAASYRLLLEDVLAARSLMADASSANRRVGLRLCVYAALWSAQNVGDKTLRARIFEALVLPHLALAAPHSTHELSRASLLEGCAAAYAASGQSEKRSRILILLIETAPTANARDAARVEQAQVLVSRGDLEGARKYLGAIESEEMSGAKMWIADLERKREADATQADKPSPVEENPDEPARADAAQEVAR